MGQSKEFDGFIELRVCPRCAKAAYALAGGAFVCEYCGYSSYDRRKAGRKASGLEFEVAVGGRAASARLLDYSETGLRVACRQAITIGTALAIDIDDLGIHSTARAVWTTQLPNGLVVAGLKFS